MVNGLISESGQSVLRPAEEEPGVEQDSVLTLSQLMVELTVREKVLSHKTATLRSVLLMVDGQDSENGQSVLLLAGEALGLELDPVTTLLLIMVELIAKEKIRRLRTARFRTAQVKKLRCKLAGLLELL